MWRLGEEFDHFVATQAAVEAMVARQVAAWAQLAGFDNGGIPGMSAANP